MSEMKLFQAKFGEWFATDGIHRQPSQLTERSEVGEKTVAQELQGNGGGETSVVRA